MRIGIDLDEVLCEFLEGVIKYHNVMFGTSLVFDDFFSYNFWEVWGGDLEDAKKKVFDFYETDFFENLSPVIGAVDCIRGLSEKHDLFIITARQDFIKDKTKIWLDSYFPDTFKDIIVVNHMSKEGISRSKGDVCDELKIDVMIEDSAIYALDCVRNYRRVLLFTKPWNVKSSISDGIIRVNSWAECVNIINK